MSLDKPRKKIALETSSGAKLRDGDAKKEAKERIKSFTKRSLDIIRNTATFQNIRSKETARMRVKKSVWFAEKVRLLPSLHIAEYSIEEQRAIWYSDDEYHEISKRCSKQINKMDRGEKLRNKKYCARGLEAHTRIGCIVKQKNRSHSIRSVLNEQERQRSQKRFDEDSIAQVYHSSSSSCQLWASTVGLRDQREVAGFIDEFAGVVALPSTQIRRVCDRSIKPANRRSRKPKIRAADAESSSLGAKQYIEDKSGGRIVTARTA